MRGGPLPPALLFAALGLALAFAPRGARLPSLIILGLTVILVTLAPIRDRWQEWVFLACWISVVVTAAAVHLPRGLKLAGALALSLNAGVWATAVVTLSGSRADLLRALPWVFVFLPGSWIVARGAPISVKVISSWLIAIAVLAATLQFLPVTPGYLPDHME